MDQIDKLNQKLKQLRKEIEEYQAKCKHKRQTIRTIKVGDTRWVCDECEKPIRWLSYEELQKWLSR